MKVRGVQVSAYSALELKKGLPVSNQIDVDKLKRIVPAFRQFLEREGEQWRLERAEKDQFFAKYFGKNEIENLDEGTLRELIHILWAFNGWTNKDWLHQEMLKSGLPEIRRAFKDLLYGTDPIAKRFDTARKKIRIMGAASISEVLTHHDHTKYPIWNRRSRKGLILLGVREESLPKSAQISGAQYAAFCKLVEGVRAEIAAHFPEFTDLFTLDSLLNFISTRDSQEPERIRETERIEDFDHDAVIEQVLELGDGLGFEVQKEFSVMRGCRIDVIWRSRIANLGTIAYAFEVHRRGSRDSAILNLQRVRRDPTIQKVILVSTDDELQTFQEEIKTLDEDFRTSVGYFEVNDLQQALNNLQNLKDTLETLGLLQIKRLAE
jgi:hypothetical protein